eukprot:TRINITY_DN10817_c0_g1_i2.p1 TRINITY_DN10817_c0_g1~~TRINITY_DN10817_c0_g1_i2.p1  ORF type:complete len:826 (+),score=168.59 TRINITY_DN10817_c0_g1_i2:2-2479(+)
MAVSLLGLVVLCFLQSDLLVRGAVTCIDPTTNAVKVQNSTECSGNTILFKTAGVNIYDVFWDVWQPTTSKGNMSTSIQALLDASAYGIKLVRCFAHPFEQTKDTTWLMMNDTAKKAYFERADTIVQAAEDLGILLVPSLGYGCSRPSTICNPALVWNETYRQMVVDNSSRTRQSLFAYARDFVTRYKDSKAIAFWELGNEFNLQLDGCGISKDAGDFIRTSDGMDFLREYRDVVLAVDSSRSINTGMAHPRPVAWHAAQSPTGCINASLALDTPEDTQRILAAYADGFDFVSIHYYGCRSMAQPYPWCDMSAPDPASRGDTHLFQVASEVAEQQGKVLYIGEYGASNRGGNDGYNHTGSQGYQYALAAIAAIVDLDVHLSTLWAFECPSHGDTPNWCLHPGKPPQQNVTWAFMHQLILMDYKLQHGAASVINNTMVRQFLPLSPGGPACLDGSRYALYYRLGTSRSKWVINMQGGGWSQTAFRSYERSKTSLGSSNSWPEMQWIQDLGPRFADFSQLFLRYCDGASFTGYRPEPVNVGNIPPEYPYTDPTPPNATVYVRGRANLEASIDYIKAHFIKDAPVEEVIVLGGSAGGLATIVHTDAIAKQLNASKVVAKPNAGFFLDYDGEPCNQSISVNCNYTALHKIMVNFHNSSGGLDASCVTATPQSDVYKCMLPVYATPFVQADMFFQQSKFDHWQLNEEAGLVCTTAQSYHPPWLNNVTCDKYESAAIAGYGEAFMDQIAEELSRPGQQRGFYLTSCIVHGIDWHYASIDDVNLESAFAQWYYRRYAERTYSNNDFHWVEDYHMPRIDNPLACPPLTFIDWHD